LILNNKNPITPIRLTAVFLSENKMHQKNALLFYLALQAIKNPKAYVNKKFIFIIRMIHKCASVKILVFSRTKNAQM